MQVLSLMWEAVIEEHTSVEVKGVVEDNLSHLLKLRAETPEYEVEASEVE